MNAVQGNNGFGSLFNRVNDIAMRNISASVPTVRERVLRGENRELSAENRDLQSQNRDLRTENRDLRTENRSLTQEVARANAPGMPEIEPIEAPAREAPTVERPENEAPKRSEPITGELIAAPRGNAPRISAPEPPPTPEMASYHTVAGAGFQSPAKGSMVNAFA